MYEPCIIVEGLLDQPGEPTKLQSSNLPEPNAVMHHIYTLQPVAIDLLYSELY